jgi:hypothetical protein
LPRFSRYQRKFRIRASLFENLEPRRPSDRPSPCVVVWGAVRLLLCNPACAAKTCAETPPLRGIISSVLSERYCVALGSRVWCFRIKHWECGCGDAHLCGLRDVQTRRKAAQCLGASSRGGGRIAEQSGGATKLRPQRREGADGSRSRQQGVLNLGQPNEGSPSLGRADSRAA